MNTLPFTSIKINHSNSNPHPEKLILFFPKKLPTIKYGFVYTTFISESFSRMDIYVVRTQSFHIICQCLFVVIVVGPSQSRVVVSLLIVTKVIVVPVRYHRHRGNSRLRISSETEC